MARRARGGSLALEPLGGSYPGAVDPGHEHHLQRGVRHLGAVRQGEARVDAQFGLLISAGAVGAIVGTPVYHLLEPRVGSLTLLRAGLIVETVVHLILALTRNPWAAGVTMAVFGVHAVVWGTVSTTARQLATPDVLLGRVNSVYLLASVGGAALGSLLGAVLAQQFGLVAPFATAFVGMLAMTAIAWRPLRHVSVRATASPG